MYSNFPKYYFKVVLKSVEHCPANTTKLDSINYITFTDHKHQHKETHEKRNLSSFYFLLQAIVHDINHVYPLIIKINVHTLIYFWKRELSLTHGILLSLREKKNHFTYQVLTLFHSLSTTKRIRHYFYNNNYMYQ